MGNNIIGFQHLHTKVSRALKRMPKDFLDRVIAKNIETYIVSPDDRAKFIVSRGTPDYYRFTRCFENICAGIFYHEFGQVFMGDIRMYLGFINYTSKNTNTFVDFLREKFNQETENIPYVGSNPEIFKYCFSPVVENGLICLKLLFYEGAEVFVSFQPEGVEKPYLLGMDLLNQGVRTIITLGDREYKFNWDNKS